jgi:ABC-type glycerol-3-phosphate transport system permease component
MRTVMVVTFPFLHTPVAVIVLFSFNEAANVSTLSDLSLQWYEKAFSNPLAISALTNSVVIALCTAAISTVIGSMAAMGFSGVSVKARDIVQSLLIIGLAIPGIVIGLASKLWCYDCGSLTQLGWRHRRTSVHQKAPVKRGITLELNAIATSALAVSFPTALIVFLIARERACEAVSNDIFVPIG